MSNEIIFTVIITVTYILCGVGTVRLMVRLGPLPVIAGVFWPVLLIVIAFIGTPSLESNND